MSRKAVAWSATLFLNLILVLVAVPGAASQSPSGEQRVFPTGFLVQGEFLHFFDSRGGVETFGYPLTTAFEQDGRLVQYFHRGRMELYSENLPGERVALGRLGVLLATSEPPLVEPLSGPDKQFFPETGHSVTATFLSYFEARGGADLFGYPITEMMVENGRIVQYFERARLEWHPDNPPGLRVQLGRLGELYLDRYPPPSYVFEPNGGGSRAVPPNVTFLDVVASVSYPYARQNQPQTLYVFVYDQNKVPLADAKVQAVVHFPDEDLEFTLPEANDMGLAWQVFDVGQVPMGETVAIDVVVSYAGIEAWTQASFLIWL